MLYLDFFLQSITCSTMYSFIVVITVVCRLVHAINFNPFDATRLHKDSFFEQFQYPDLASSPWLISEAEKFDQGRDEWVTYSGKWSIEAAKKWPVFENEKGLVLKSIAAHHAISNKLPTPFNNTDKDLVLQYEISLQSGFECGGAYIKLLDLQDDYSMFSSHTPFQIMFGPDVCGANNKVHFIIASYNPISGESEEKHINNLPLARTGDLTTLYTLIIKTNQDFEIRINGQVAKAGNLVLDEDVMSPRLNPPLEIIDKYDSKPLFWDDREYIPDPDSSLNYDPMQNQRQIPDPDAVKPDDWDENEQSYIEDPNAKQPANWNNEIDGIWLAPEIINPKCVGISGCGPWSPPLIDNPSYKGEWIQNTIENPNYQGEWHPRMIANPDYYENETPSNLKEIGAIGFELWSMNENIMFNNIYLGHSIEEAEIIGNETWKLKYKLQDEMKQLNLPYVKFDADEPPKNFDELILEEGISTFKQFLIFVRLFCLKEYLELTDFLFELFRDPVHAAVNNPFSLILYGTLFCSIVTIAFGILGVITFLLSNGLSSISGDTSDEPDQNAGNELEDTSEIHSSEEEEVKVNSLCSVSGEVRKRKT